MPRDIRILNEILHAIQNNKPDEVRHIFEHRIRKRDRTFTPLSFGCVTEVDDKVMSEYESVILAAARLEDTTILKYLLNSGININFMGESPLGKVKARVSPLHVAVGNMLPDTVALLVEANADVNKVDHQGRSPLHLAIKRVDCSLVRLLLQRGANVSLLDRSGTSPLQMAAKYGHVELVRILLEHNAQVFHEKQCGPCPLLVAAAEGHVPLIDLFSRYVDVNITSKCSDTQEKAALHVAAEKGHVETVRFLVERFGADVNVRDSEEQTPLHCLLLHRHDYKRMRRKEDYDGTAEFLMNQGICVSQQNSKGDTALHFAARNQFHRIAEMLLLAGSDATTENKEGLTAKEVIPEYDVQMRQLFNKYAAFTSPYLKITRDPGTPTSEQPPASPSHPSSPTKSPLAAHLHAQVSAGRKCVATGLYAAVFHNVPSEPTAPNVED